MSLRQIMNRNPAVATGVMAVVIVACGWYAYSSTAGQRHEPDKLAFYTVDNGATWFADSKDQIPPFDKGGKIAVRAHVFSCDGGKPFVFYLEKYKDGTKQVTPFAMLVKKPGDKDWVSVTSAEARTRGVTAVVCPGGRDVPLEEIKP